MQKTFLFLASLIIIVGCSDDDEPASSSKSDLLTGGSQKAWYVYDTSDDDPCPSSADDSWTFFANGDLNYNHGTITESDADQCSDLVNFDGSWEFADGETKIEMVAEENSDTGEDLDDFTLINGTISTLTEDRLVISSTMAFIEFRKK
jgi:hypothetical protein